MSMQSAHDAQTLQLNAPSCPPERGRKDQPNGYRWGSGYFRDRSPVPVPTPILIPSAKERDVATHGFELLEPDGTFVAWFEDFIDAREAHKSRPNVATIVRCSDRALVSWRAGTLSVPTLKDAEVEMGSMLEVAP